MRNVFVTGATSMLGVALIEECIRQNTHVYALIRPSSGNLRRLPDSDMLTVIECELSDLRGLTCFGLPAEIDAFYHFGWQHTTKAGRNSPGLQAENILYSLEAVRLAAKLGCRKFIGAGSQAEYGIHRTPATSPSTHPEPVTPYGISKLAAGRLCSHEAGKLGLSFAWVRIFSVYGENDSPESMISTILRSLMKNEHCALTQGIQNWDYLYSLDAGRAFYMLGANGSGTYCLGSGQARSIRSYVEDMKAAAGSTSELGFGEIPYENGTPPGMCADISALTRDTGFKPSVSFKDGIANMIANRRGGGGQILRASVIALMLLFRNEEEKNAA